MVHILAWNLHFKKANILQKFSMNFSYNSCTHSMIETLQQFVFSSNLKLKLLISLFILLLISMSFCGSYCQVYARKLLWFCTFWPQLGNPVWHILMPQEMWESLRRIHRLYLKFLVTYRHVKHFYLHLSELQLVSDISDFILNDFPFFLFPREHFSSAIWTI